MTPFPMRASRPALSVPRVAALLVLGIGPLACAGEHSIPAKSQNYDGAPIVSRSSSAMLVEQQATSRSTTTSVSPAVGRTLVSTSSDGDSDSTSRFVSSASVKRKTTAAASTEHRLKGEIRCWNKSPKTADALGLLVVPLDEDANALSSGRKSLARVDGPIRSGQELSLPWELSVKAPDVAEVNVIILSVKFDDGTVWQAPDVEKVDFF